MNEKFAPELLENKSEIVECVMEQLQHMVRGGPSAFRGGQLRRCVGTVRGRRLKANLFRWAQPSLGFFFSFLMLN